MKKLLRYLADYKKECLLGPLFKVLEVIFELLVPLAVASMIDRGIGGGDRGHIIRMALLLALLAAVGLTSTLIAQFFAAKAAVGFAAKLRHALMAHIQRMTYSDLDRAGTSELITRMTSDVSQVQNGVNLAIRLLTRSPIIVFGAMIMAFTVDGKSALVFACVIPALAAVVLTVMLVTIPMYRKVQGQLDTVTDATRDTLDGVRAIRAFRLESREIARFREKNSLLTAMQEKVGSIAALMNPATYVLLNGAVIVLLHVGALRVNAGGLTQGAVIALYNYMSQILVELIKLANLIITLNKTAACGDRIAAVLETGGEPEPAGQKTALPSGQTGSIVFEGVSFTYPDAAAPALTDISFAAERGEVIGIIGGTGSGKSTLVSLIPRFYEPTEGRILIGGIPAAEYDKQALRARIGVVPQKALLFHGTIRENLLWGNPAADDSVLQAALETAQAADIVAAKEKGLDEPVAEGGRNFSGGQRQRLTIARALVRRPDILILDDSASALDYATDLRLRQALRALPDRPTVFIVSQRTASIQHADRILVLEDGHTAGIGTHETLLQTCPVYREIYASQFPKEVS
ncbi:MAG: ABC transporter ATP-binding protein [Oscillospiraceae bacterium]|nr:ABC transporter ATP-binding protein [Oscillospiraceae bacterium]